jgi:histidinol dehydrogenase
MMKIIQTKNRAAMNRLLRARDVGLENAEPVARRIVEDVRRNGDRALIRYAKQFDGTHLVKEGFTVTRAEIREAYRNVPREFIEALRQAERNIRKAAERQLPRPWRSETTAGVVVRQIVRPLESVACYIPGGRFPLPSTVLMSVIPAQVAGVKEIFVTSPRPAPAVLVTADALGIKKIYRLGGAQAIAAFAYGTQSVPRAAKIVGPGNKFVAAAKKIVAGDCGIDFVAGPTELVMVGSRGRPDWIAADLVAQAEHDPDAVAIFITPSARLAADVQISIGKILRRLRLPIAEQSLARQGAIIVTQNVAEAIQIANTFAPEHLTLLEGAITMLDQVHAAGSIFLGDYSAVAAGDYASGTNHILPTSGMARLRGGLSAADFVKTITVQQLTRQGLARLRPAIVRLAATEGLRAHADSVESRFEKGRGKV